MRAWVHPDCALVLGAIAFLQWVRVVVRGDVGTEHR